MTPDEQLDYWRRRHEADSGSRAFAPLAELHLAGGRIAEALALLAAGLARHPSFLAAWLIEARCRVRTGDTAGARRALSEALLLDPDNLLALRLLAELAESGAEGPELDRLLRRIVRLDPADDATRERLAARRSEPEPPLAAAPSAAPAVRAEPARAAAAAEGAPEPPLRAPQATATLTLARIYRAQGHRQKALEVLRQVLALHPERPDIRAEIAALECDLAGNAPAGPAPAAPEPGGSVAGRQESRPHFEAWLARLGEPARDERRQAGPG